MKRGDLVLCEGFGRLSRKIKLYQKFICKARPPGVNITHLAIMCSDKHVFETTTLNTWNGKKGAQVNEFQEWNYHYKGSVWIRRQRKEIPDSYRIPKIIEDRYPDSYPYENGILGLLELLLIGLSIPGFRLQTKYPHCTEAVANILQELGVICKDSVRTNKMPPFEWWYNLDEWYYEPELIKL